MNEENKTLADVLAAGAEVPAEPQETPAEGNGVDIIALITNPTPEVQEVLQQLVNDAVKKVLAGTAPKRSTVKVDPITKADFDAMTYEQRETLYNTDRGLYDRLTRE